MKRKHIVRTALITFGILLIPLIAMQCTPEVVWTLSDFAVMGTLIMGTGLMYEFVASRANNTVYKVGVGLAVLASFLIVWINLAVEIIGDDNPVNALYFGVVLIGIVGVFLSRLTPQGLSRTAFSMAIAQALVPVVALFVSPLNFAPGVPQVFMLNAFFVVLFLVSALLLRHVTKESVPS